MDIEWLKSNVFPYVNLLIFITLLLKFGKKPLQTMLQERRNQFVKNRDEAAKLYNEAKVANDKVEARLAGLQTEVAEIKREALKAAEWEGEQAIARARQVAQTIVAEAQITIDAMAKEAANRIKERLVIEVTNLAVANLQAQVQNNPAAAEKLIMDNIQTAGNRVGELTQ